MANGLTRFRMEMEDGSISNRLKANTEQILNETALNAVKGNANIVLENSPADTFKSAYKVAAADHVIGKKELKQLIKLAKGVTGEFASAFKVAASEKGISPAEVATLNNLLGI